MARLIRRYSMERLELYDLDKLITIPPPIPPARKCHERRPSMNPTYERYKFLCNMTRSKTDPIYAATPMFTTIPQSSQENTSRQLLGSYIRLENVKPLSLVSSKSSEPKSVKIIEVKKQNEDDRNGNIQTKENNENENQFDNGSNSSDNDEVEGYNDDYTKGIVEQIFNRDQKD